MVGKIDITVGFSDHHALVCMGSDAIKVIAGIRRCGKTRLAFTFFRELLRKSSVPDDPVIEDTLDDGRDQRWLSRRQGSLMDDDGILTMGLFDFRPDPNSLDS
ncbi:AAA family ATPase [Olsenella uli]|uniref:AAA family ATPase n=1 Tax=Olsenella uli TaxID=133926 RepID=UPI0019567C39|nr:AAA family ATPase [Olsenella uli]